MKSKQGRRFSLSAMRMSDKIILGALATLVVVLIVLSIMQRCGLSLINGALMMYLPFVALFLLIGWGVYALVRRLKNRVAKIAVTSLAVLAIFLGVVWVFTGLASLVFFVVPQRYAVVKSPSGARELVVLRVFDSDQDRVSARQAARLAANPDSPEALRPGDLCQIYSAFPRALGVFYRSNADVEGELRLAYSDPASPEEGALPVGTLKLEWLDDEATAHFFVEDPGPEEGGDLYVRF